MFIHLNHGMEGVSSKRRALGQIKPRTRLDDWLLFAGGAEHLGSPLASAAI